MPPGLGSNVVIGLGNESAWPTAVARTKFLRGVFNKTGGLKDPVIQAKGFRGHNDTDSYRGVKKVELSLGLQANYIGDEFLLYHLFGAVATTHPGTLAYQHVFTLAAANLPGLSVEVVDDVQGYVFNGCKVAKATYKFTPGGIVEKTFDLVGVDEALVSATSASFPAFQPVLFDHVLLKMDTSTTLTFKEAELTIDNGLLSDRPQMGARTILEPAIGRRSITGKVTVYFETDARRADFRAHTSRKLNLVATAGAASIETSHAFTDDVELGIVKFSEVDQPVADSGYIMQTYTFVALDSAIGANDAVKETLKTTTASVP